jgi:DNA replication protein DnaC
MLIAGRQRQSYRAFLAELLMAECDDRGRPRSESRIRAAAFPREKSLHPFDFAANPYVDAVVINTLATCDWVRKGRPLCFGRRLRCWEITSAHRAGNRSGHGRLPGQVHPGRETRHELVEAADEMTLTKTIARYGCVALFCIDGYMTLDERGAELLFQVLTEREEKASVAIATNEAFSG